MLGGLDGGRYRSFGVHRRLRSPVVSDRWGWGWRDLVVLVGHCDCGDVERKFGEIDHSHDRGHRKVELETKEQFIE